MRLSKLALTGLLISTVLSAPCHAERLPRPGAADERVKTLTYHDSDVYRIKGHYGFTTTIEFGAAETIETISVGDSESWQITKPSRPNILFLKPLEPNARTNMTVFTTRHIYTFELAADHADSPQSPDLTFRLKFKYPDNQSAQLSALSPPAFGLQAGTPVQDWNFDYAYAGDHALRPQRAFDDGVFTYFQFSASSVLPAVFAVDEDGQESLVNFTMQGPYLIVNTVARQFTLRDGTIATCIFNQRFTANPGTQDNPAPLQTVALKTAHANVPLPPRKPAQSRSLLAWLDDAGAKPVQAGTLND